MIGVMVQIDERRHGDRLAVHYGAALHREGETLPVEMLDISSGGCKVKLRPRLARGETVTLEIESFGSLAAVVAWAREGQAGLRFTESEERVAELAMAMATYGPA